LPQTPSSGTTPDLSENAQSRAQNQLRGRRLTAARFTHQSQFE
jgi:hypothetical protein